MDAQKIKQVVVWTGTVLAWSALGLFITATALGATWRVEPSPQLSAAVDSVKAIVPRPFVASAVTCPKLQTEAAQAVDEYNKEQKLTWHTSDGATFGSGNYINRQKLYKIFYSPALDTCIKVIVEQTLMKNDNKFNVFEEIYAFDDAFTDEMIDGLFTAQHGSPYFGMADVAKKINEFKTSTTSPVNLSNP